MDAAPHRLALARAVVDLPPRTPWLKEDDSFHHQDTKNTKPLWPLCL
jgi:hypothetical protein